MRMNPTPFPSAPVFQSPRSSRGVSESPVLCRQAGAVLLPAGPTESSFTTEQAARALGYTAETILKHRAQLGAYRLGRSGPWRFPASSIAFFQQHPKFLAQPKAALQELFRLVQEVNALSQERERRSAAALKAFEKRLSAVEIAHSQLPIAKAAA